MRLLYLSENNLMTVKLGIKKMRRVGAFVVVPSIFSCVNDKLINHAFIYCLISINCKR
ncbi:hypothetical protein MCO_01749 [Bartonella sp. DB5-6]|nr:hypothetical protein MCO_01749 [Bartonella sp. DB5-6]